MPFSNSSLSAQVKSYLTFLPEEIRQKILEHLHGVIHYEPVIGIMGKSGTGKSSLCNAIFQSRICATHPLNGCTRQAHRLTLQIGERRMTLVDLPGIGETPQHDQEYRELYRQLLPELDLIIWILRADERAYAADIAMHQFLLNEGADPRVFCLFSAMPIACFLLKNGMPQKNAHPVTRNSHWQLLQPGWQPCSRHHFRYSPLLRLSAGIFRRLCR